MSHIYVERREPSGVALTWDIAHHMYARHQVGRVLVVSNAPNVTKAALRKQWMKVLRKIRKEYSSTINPRRREYLEHVIVGMQTIKFIVGTIPKRGGWVYLITPAELADMPLTFHTVYLLTPATDAQNDRILELIVYHGLLVEYVVG